MIGKAASAAPVLRTCVICRKVQPRGKLLRVCLEGERVRTDADNRGAGRGAYICKTIECLSSTRLKRKAFSRAFRQNLAERRFDDFFVEISDLLQVLKGNEALDNNKSKLNDKRNN